MVITQIFVDSQTITLGVESSDIKHTQTLYQHVWMQTGWKGMVDFLCLDWIWPLS